MLWIQRVAVFVAVLATSCSSALAQGAAIDPVRGGGTITIENASTRLVLSPDGGIQSLALHDGRELLAQADARLMLLRIGGKWHNSSSLAVSRDADAYRLLVGFDGIQVTAEAIIKPPPTYFEIRCEGLQGDGCEEVVAGSPQVLDDYGIDRGPRTGRVPARAGLPSRSVAWRPIRGDPLNWWNTCIATD